MLLVIVSCASAVIGLLIGGIVTAVINAAKGRTLTLPVKLLLSVVIGAVLVLGTGVAYFGSYYRAEDTAKEYLKGKGEVRVCETDNGWLFDGPGEDAAVIFYPGGKVEASAYAPLMYKIADNGEDCFLV
ncbi:MAG: hypothetical protein IJ723_06710 [Ruminococcus sp.]|nr:hypothetical protein [Ruminococcus sp.]